jgi:hypothetical protein
MTLPQAARACFMHCVSERQGAYRSRDPEPCALIGHPLSLLFFAAMVANGLRVLLLTRAWFSLDSATR